MPKVTVLMPVYNAENYLRESVESILEQTFTDFEFLIIDDGSTDGSIDIIHSYQDTRIRLVKNDRNMGISNSLNKGIELAKSDIIARMDADDISLPERLMKQYGLMNNNPEFSLISANVEKISASGESLRKFYPDPKHFYYYLTFHCWGIYHPTVMYRKQPVQDVGKYPLTLSEDFRLWSKLVRKYRFYHMSEILVKYRVTNQSISNSLLYKEYRDAEKTYIINNLKYFLGEHYSLPDAWLEAYRNNAGPICTPPDVGEMVRCIKELDEITHFILAKENVNRDMQNIKSAAEQKKEDVIESFLKQISIPHKIHLLIRTGNFRRLLRFLTKGAFKHAKKFRTQS